jgi:dUTP pyrophosphatase
MNINIINKSNTPCRYETIASAGMDLRANITDAITLKPERTIVKQVFYRAAYWL